MYNAHSCKIVRIKHAELHIIANFCPEMSFLYMFYTERAQLKLDASAVFTAMGLNERLFICSSMLY